MTKPPRCKPSAPTAVPATDVKLSRRALAELRAATAELDEALSEMNRTEAELNEFGLTLDAEGRKFHDGRWWPSCERRALAEKAFVAALKRHGVGVVFKGGRVFAGWSALASKCEELTEGCEVFDLGRVVILD